MSRHIVSNWSLIVTSQQQTAISGRINKNNPFDYEVTSQIQNKFEIGTGNRCPSRFSLRTGLPTKQHIGKKFIKIQINNINNTRNVFHCILLDLFSYSSVLINNKKKRNKDFKNNKQKLLQVLYYTNAFNTVISADTA